FRGSRVWAMGERTRHTTRCQENWLTDTTQTLAFAGCCVVLKYQTSLTTLSILLLRGHRWFRIRFTPSGHRCDQLAALYEGILHPIPSHLPTRLWASGVFGFPGVHTSSRIVEPMEKSGLLRKRSLQQSGGMPSARPRPWNPRRATK